MRVLEGKREWGRQNQLYLEGRTTLKAPASKHNCPPDIKADGKEDVWLSPAVDIVPYPIDWQDAKRFIYMAGMLMGIGRAKGHIYRWGGNWDMDQVIIDDQNFDDLPHFELIL